MTVDTVPMVSSSTRAAACLGAVLLGVAVLTSGCGGPADASAAEASASASPSVDVAETASAAPRPEVSQPANQDRARLPKDFPQAVPLPSNVKVENIDTLGRGVDRTWAITLTAPPNWKTACRTYTQALAALGFDLIVDGDSRSGSGSALRGRSHDVTVLCDRTSTDLVVNPTLSF